MASKIRGVYEERWDTPPIVEEYKQAKLSRARSRWRAYKYITYGVTAAAAALVLLDESISGKRAAANANYGLGGVSDCRAKYIAQLRAAWPSAPHSCTG